MRQFTRYGVVAVVLSSFIGLAAFTGVAYKGDMKTITVVNKTDFNIDRVFLSPVEEKAWGDDILDESEILKPGDQVDIEIECGEWDVKLVAGDESTCELSAVNICAADIWEVTSDCGTE
jgi:pyridoxal biosynthesis lyase PdxS